MKTTIRLAALLTAVSLVSGCTNGLRLHDRHSKTVKLPSAPTLDANPADAGTVGSPDPVKSIAPNPAGSAFENN